MSEIIFCILFFLAIALIPYRKIYNRLNQLLDARAFLISLVMMAFPFAWKFMAPEITDPSQNNQSALADMASTAGAFSVTLSWLIAVCGIAMIIYAIWTAPEHQKKMNSLNQSHKAEN